MDMVNEKMKSGTVAALALIAKLMRLKYLTLFISQVTSTKTPI